MWRAIRINAAAYIGSSCSVGHSLCMLQLHLCRAIKCKWTASCTIFGRRLRQLFCFRFNIFRFIDSFVRHIIRYCQLWCHVCVPCAFCRFRSNFKRDKPADTHVFWLLIWKINKTQTQIESLLLSISIENKLDDLNSRLFVMEQRTDMERKFGANGNFLRSNLNNGQCTLSVSLLCKAMQIIHVHGSPNARRKKLIQIWIAAIEFRLNFCFF